MPHTAIYICAGKTVLPFPFQLNDGTAVIIRIAVREIAASLGIIKGPMDHHSTPSYQGV